MVGNVPHVNDCYKNKVNNVLCVFVEYTYRNDFGL